MTIRIRRGLAMLVIDSIAWAFSIVLATMARFEFSRSSVDWQGVALVAGVAVVAQMVVGGLLGLYTGRRRSASFEEAGTFAACAALIGAGLFIWLAATSGVRPVPLSVAIGASAMTVVLALGIRYLVRLRRESKAVSYHDRDHRTIIYGAGEAGEEVVRALLEDPTSNLLPVVFLDDDPGKLGLRIKGRRVVGGRRILAETARRFNADSLIIAFPSGSRHDVALAAKEARKAGLRVLILPRVAKMLETEIGVADIRDIRFGDFLGRDEVDLDLDRIAGFITGRRVLVTGAGGSIGSELCAALLRFGPAELFMLDRDENALHALQLRLEGRALLDTESLIVADIRDAERMAEAMHTAQPDVVFHAAALKHLPFLERYPREGLKTNVHGTLNLLEAARQAGCRAFVNISTDKAADPVSVLGLTKRIGERLTAGYSDDRMVAISVRFGNVLGSQGSVIPSMRHQIASGGPVTVTDPNVSRYFMTVEEAVQLVIQAAAIGRPGEVLVLEMGEPVLIVDMARELIAEISPTEEIDIEFTGLRPGEKLTEVLVASDDVLVGNPHEGITSYSVPLLPIEALSAIPGEPEALVSGLVSLCAADAEVFGAVSG